VILCGLAIPLNDWLLAARIILEAVVLFWFDYKSDYWSICTQAV
jgi:hypothetical protein